MGLLSLSILILLIGGVLAAAFARSPRASSWTGAFAAIVASVLGLSSTIRTLLGAMTASVSFPWRVPGGHVALSSDPLSAFFLVPIFVLGGIGALYGREYLLTYRHEKSLGAPWLGYNLLLASMVVVVTARHGLLFLVAWELMSLSSYVLIVFEHERADARRAGWVYLIAAHVGMAFLVAMFLLIESETGTFLFGTSAQKLANTPRSVVLLLALLGFGTKAGLVPMHVWLPEAHAAAPSHVSALMSGVVIKMGIYGIVRITLLGGPPPAWWGQLLVVIGLFGALYGISMASSQRDLKRVLAYSSVENIGLIALGFGLGFWGIASGRPVLGAFGVWGALLHVWNHSAMKGLLFLGAGGVLHATGTKDLEKLGGLMSRAPSVGGMLILGCLAISALPPLNGFVSEWLMYRSLLDGAAHGAPGASVACSLALGGLSAVGALAALCFLRVCGAALLGEPRDSHLETAHEVGRSMVVAMSILSATCLLVAFAPASFARVFALVAGQVAPANAAHSDFVIGALFPVGHAMRALAAVLLIAAAVYGYAARRTTRVSGPTWGCGYVAPTTRMQYTARSFGQPLSELLPALLRPVIRVLRPSGLFPVPSQLETQTEDPFTSRIFEPAILDAGRRMARLRWIQQGAVHVYLLYILVALAVGLAWASLGNAGG